MFALIHTPISYVARDVVLAPWWESLVQPRRELISANRVFTELVVMILPVEPDHMHPPPLFLGVLQCVETALSSSLSSRSCSVGH